MLTRLIRASIAGAFAAGAAVTAAQAQGTIKLGYIDPLSGPMAAIGDQGLKQFQYWAEKHNAAGGVNGKKLEIVAFDGKLNPQESLVQLQKAIDAGIRFIAQGNGSSVAAAMNEAVAKHNDRNPGKEVLYLNYAAVDPVLTNDKCTFSHFRWDAHVDVKMEALTNYMKGNQAIKKVYLINQDYSFGHAVKNAANAMLKAKRPDVQIVGDELHPIAKITDFSPYIAKIKASGADSVITGNWGADISLLLKAAAEAGLNVSWYTYYAGGAGGPTAIKQTGLDHRVFDITEGKANNPFAPAQEIETAFRAKYPGLGVWLPRIFNTVDMLAAAIKQAKSEDPVKVGKALEGLKMTTFNGGPGFMRKDDHQFFQDMYISSFGSLKAGDKFDEEKTGWGWRVIAKIPAEQTVVPTTCKMSRPG